MKAYLVFFLIKIVLLYLPFNCLAQVQKKMIEEGLLIKQGFASSAFPVTLRKLGYDYKNQHYNALKHYNDSTVLIYIPKYFKSTEKVDLVFHFHGWYNNVDSVISQFNLIEQFFRSGKNALLILPQGPKNAPDSYGGKLENKEQFQKLTSELLSFLRNEDIINSMQLGNIILSGHSGAYRVMAYILMQGGLTANIKEVLLFDGLYSQQEKFTWWIAKQKGRLTNIYTDDGGTFENSKNFALALDAWNVPAVHIKEKDLKDFLNGKYQVRSVYSPMDHNDVIHKNRNFELLIKYSTFLKSD
ncbi:MAG: hypothetical protein AAGI07_16210 [Bacteroidota bacterium]